MKAELDFYRSSCLVSLPIMAGSLLLCVLAAFFGQRRLAVPLMLLFLLAAVSRLWAAASARRLSLQISTPNVGLFPGETAVFEIEVRNEKFMPMIWLELYFPLAKTLCLTPEAGRRPDDWELPALEASGSSTQLVGEKRFSFLLWYETVRFTSQWTANRRGVYSTRNWRLRTGDGFGLAQTERPLPDGAVRSFSVYPRLVDVSPDLFLRRLWNADAGARGVMEDPTVIRSTRDYMTSDPLKRINWRLAARGLPLSVNVYEDILPQSIHFFFDGDSFNGPPSHLEEMEDALSILGSELVRLAQAQVQCGLSLSKGDSGQAVNRFAEDALEELLCALAAYQPEKPALDEEGKPVRRIPVFDESPVFETAQKVGRFYYILYDVTDYPRRGLLYRLDPASTTILSYQDPGPYGDYEVASLRRLKEEKAHA